MNEYDKALFEAGEALIAALKELNTELRELSATMKGVILQLSDGTADHRD